MSVEHSEQGFINLFRQYGLLIGFTVAYLIAAFIGALVTGNQEFIYYIAVMLVLIAVTWTVHRSVTFSRPVLWALSLWGLAHMAGGLLQVPESWPVNGDSRVLYNWWVIPGALKWDHIVHMYGFGVMTFVCWQIIVATIRHRADSVEPSLGLVVLAACASQGFGALNEVVEFFATLMMPSTNVGGYVNTGWDLVANLAGATIAGLMIWADIRRSRRYRKLAE